MTQPAEDSGKNGPSAKASDGDARRAAVHIEADDSQVVAAYSNFCRVHATPEELIVDFGLSTQSGGPQQHPIKLTQRVVVNYYTAKRLVQLLHMAVQRHESTFGVLETDIQKRVANR